MKAWVIDKISDLQKENKPLKRIELPKPKPKEGELLIKVHVCGICHTEIDEIEGRTPPPVFPVVPGHQIVGTVEKSLGMQKEIKVGNRVGVAWIYYACGECEFCTTGRENLCPEFSGYGERCKRRLRRIHGGA